MSIDFNDVHPDSHPIFGKDWKREEVDAQKPASPYDLTIKGILRTPALHEYILETSVYPREHKALRGLRLATEKHAWHVMSTTGDEGQFLGFLLKLLNAKNTIELGVFTGYSLLSTALALPEDGKVIGVDMNRDSYDIGAPFFEEAGVAHKVDFREGNGLEILNKLLSEEKHHGFFDFAFVDADKDNYENYHPLMMKLIRVGGIVAYDNTLWGGSVADDDEASMSDMYLKLKPFIMNFNKVLAADPSIDISQVSISDGVTLCRRLV